MLPLESPPQAAAPATATVRKRRVAIFSGLRITSSGYGFRVWFFCLPLKRRRRENADMVEGWWKGAAGRLMFPLRRGSRRNTDMLGVLSAIGDPGCLLADGKLIAIATPEPALHVGGLLLPWRARTE